MNMPLEQKWNQRRGVARFMMILQVMGIIWLMCAAVGMSVLLLTGEIGMALYYALLSPIFGWVAAGCGVGFLFAARAFVLELDDAEVEWEDATPIAVITFFLFIACPGILFLGFVTPWL